MEERIRKGKDILLDFLYPPLKHCVYCGTERNLVGDHLCKECEKRQEQLEIPRAFVLENHLVHSLYRYDGIVKDLIHRMKFGKASYLARYMAQQMARYIQQQGLEVDFLTFVPIHKSRYRVREFDQSEKLCKFLSENLQIPFGVLLKKTRKNSPQSSLHKTERQQNVKGVYQLEPKWEGKLEGKVVYLMDDVLTTGSTALECARVLKPTKAAEIHIFTFAKSGV